MNFDPELLDKLARCFAETALRDLEIQIPADATTPAGIFEQCSGRRLGRHPVTPYFESLTTISDRDPRPRIGRI